MSARNSLAGRPRRWLERRFGRGRIPHQVIVGGSRTSAPTDVGHSSELSNKFNCCVYLEGIQSFIMPVGVPTLEARQSYAFALCIQLDSPTAFVASD